MGSTPRSRTLGTSASKVPNVGYRADPLSATGRDCVKTQNNVSIADTSRATAFRDIEDLVKNGLLLAEGTGRGTRYNLALPGWEWKRLPQKTRANPKLTHHARH